MLQANYKKSRNTTVVEVLGMSQRTKLILLGACIGGLTYIFGGCLLSTFYVPDAVIIAWWFGLMGVSLIALAWATWPKWTFWN